MYQFTTVSGTTFEVADSRITRKPDPYTPPEVAFGLCPPLQAERFRWEAPPTIGAPAVFTRLPLLPGSRITTSIVVDIVGLPDPWDMRLPWEDAIVNGFSLLGWCGA